MDQDNKPSVGRYGTVTFNPPTNTSEQLSFNLDAVGELPGGICPVVNDFAEVQEKRKQEGRCLHCGEPLQVRWTGLEDCKVCSDATTER